MSKILLVTLILISFLMKPSVTVGADNKKASINKKWSLTIQGGWATNIDYAVLSQSSNYRFNDAKTGVNGKFHAYDSRENLTQFEGDQANNYLLTLKNDRIGYTITSGVIHDKRQQAENSKKKTFRYTQGGMSPCLMIGFHHKLVNSSFGNIGMQVRAGGYINWDNIEVDLYDPLHHVSFDAKNRTRSYAGGGFVAMSNLSYERPITNSWLLSLSVNGTFMAGTAETSAYMTNHINGSIHHGNLGVDYASLSIGPSIGFTYQY